MIGNNDHSEPWISFSPEELHIPCPETRQARNEYKPVLS
jgi:hypothetical protein